ncbi:DNA-3-methyladenine glycosylase family protein [Halovivax limisalsi]|uniref:DNA-3-methyladenine glycosylase family protein n=1 Tax=Halovivax limisalsi TaxID=1453760 RepID=UPI001FFDCCAC|nr:DNA glycosylase [Halovivax limisalsi]
METGEIPSDELAGGFSPYLTIESGQTYRWTRSDGELYSGRRAPDAWYELAIDGEVVRVRSIETGLEWRSTTDAAPILRRRLRLDDDLDRIVDAAPDDPLVERAFDAHRGLRLVADPAFDTLISFICSAQMRVERINSMVDALAREYGTEIAFDGRIYHDFPTPAQLARATETELRDLGLGYRAPYVVETARMVADGEAHPAEAREMPYEDAREYLTRFVGVGEKVADCALLFSLGFDEAVPLDTWIRKAIASRYPECDRGSYAATSRAIRDRFGGEYAGYVQTYVFHHLRTGAEPVEPPT